MQEVVKSVRSLEALLLCKSKHHRKNRVTVYRERCQESEWHLLMTAGHWIKSNHTQSSSESQEWSWAGQVTWSQREKWNEACQHRLRQIRRVLEGSQQGRNTVGFKKLWNLCLFPTSASVIGKNKQSFLDWEEKIISFPKSLWKINPIVSHTKTPSAQQTSNDTVNLVRTSCKKEAPFAPF